MPLLKARKDYQLLKIKLDNSKEKKKILIRAPNWIGDGVLSIPATEAVKKIFPDAELTIMTKPWVAPVFYNNPGVDAIIEYDINGRHRGLAGKWKLIEDIKKKGFDLVILFQNAFEAALLTFLAGIPVRVGYKRDLRGPLLSHSINVDPSVLEKHQVFYYLALLERFGIEVDDHPKPKLYVTPEEENWGRESLVREGMAGSIVVGMAPGASYGPAKRWESERFAAVAGMLIKKYGVKVILYGGKDDYNVCREIVDKCGSNALNFAGKTTLRQFITLVNLSTLFITNDSGPMHISAALDVPTIALFGSTDHTLTGPLSENSVVIKKDIECSPCFNRTCHKWDYRCLKEIKVNDVYQAGQQIIEEKGMKENVQRGCFS